MTIDELFIRKAVVAGSGLVYWAGVLILARRVRKTIGRSPNLKPRGPKEQFLWLGWLLVIATWIGQPLFAGSEGAWAVFQFMTPVLQPGWLAAGLVLAVAGYAGTLWCYAIMGSAWRIGVNPEERNALITTGPFARIRHPIYAFQIVMLAGAWCLLPTAISAVVLVFHAGCAWVKARDEEVYLLTVHGDSYRNYCARTGRLYPRIV